MKRILIIGATSAIAAACARLWAKDGAEFFLVGRNTEKLEQVSNDLKVHGATAVSSYRLDATDIAAHSVMMKICLTTLKQIDIALIALSKRYKIKPTRCTPQHSGH